MADFSQVKISAPVELARLGYTMAFDGETLVLGGQEPAAGTGPGVVLVLRPDGEGGWTREATLQHPDIPHELNYFGYSVSLSGDDLYVASPLALVDIELLGGVWAYHRTSGIWNEVEKIVASDNEPADRFGNSVSADGSIMVVGAFMDDDGGAHSGSAYVFERSDGVWAEVQKLTAPDAQAEHYFGQTVAVSGGMIAVAAPYDDEGGTNSGAIYTFRKTVEGTWTFDDKLIPSLSNPGDLFGYSLAASGDSVMIGCVGVTQDFQRGESAYVFTHGLGGWVEEGRLVASDGAPLSAFGEGIAISGDIAVVGAYRREGYMGAAYVFKRTAGVWEEQEKITAPDGGGNDEFGRTVAVAGDTAMISAQRALIGGRRYGAVYEFRESKDDWFRSKITHSEHSVSPGFGSSIAVSGNTLVAGSGPFSFYQNVSGRWMPEQEIYQSGSVVALDGGIAVIGDQSSDDAGSSSGSAWVYVSSPHGWEPAQKLTASDASAAARFGRTVAISGDTMVIGAPALTSSSPPEPGWPTGAAYIFQRTGDTWIEQAKLVPDDGNAGDQFGDAVAISGDTVIIGSPKYEDESELPVFYDRGAAYIFKRTGATWQQQQRLTEASPSSQYASSVAISGNTAVVGSDTYSANVYTQTAGVWSFQQSLPSPTKEPSAGRVVAIDGDRIAVGAYRAMVGDEMVGVVSLFHREGTAWITEGTFTPPDTSPEENYGRTISLSRGTLAIGAPDHDDSGPDSGAAYVVQELGVGNAWMLK